MHETEALFVVCLHLRTPMKDQETYVVTADQERDGSVACQPERELPEERLGQATWLRSPALWKILRRSAAD